VRLILEMARQPEIFDRLMKRRPDNARLLLARGRLRANQGEWAKACEDYSICVQQQGTTLGGPGIADDVLRGRAATLYELAALRLLSGDEAGYRSICDTVLHEQSTIEDSVTACFASRTLSLASSSRGESSAAAVRLMELAVGKSQPLAWFVYARGLAYTRAGRFAEGIAQFEESLRLHPAWIGRGLNYAGLAITYSKLNRPEEARKWLQKAHALSDETDARFAGNTYGYASTAYLNDALALRVLLREADALINPGSDASGKQ
jgi:tetratricopeptide (TPR) repeat protein